MWFGWFFLSVVDFERRFVRLIGFSGLLCEMDGIFGLFVVVGIVSDDVIGEFDVFDDVW